jgi:LAO/AO transport system kinase
VNKCDGPLEAQARSTLSDYASALRLVRPTSASWTPVAQVASAITGLGIDELWSHLLALRDAHTASGEFDTRRRSHDSNWLWVEVGARLLDRLRADDRVRAIEADVRSGRRSLTSAVDAVLDLPQA